MTKIAVLGCGHWGKNIIKSLDELGSLYAVNDISSALSLSFTTKYKVLSLSLDEICQDPKVDGVVVALPATSHFEVSRKILEAGKHVFVEKPIALSVEEADTLNNLAQKRNLKLMVGHLLQYHPAFREAKKILLKGELGKIKFMHSRRLSFGKVRSVENALWSFSPHDISMILSLAQNLPRSVFAKGQTILEGSTGDIYSLMMDFGNNLQAKIDVSWAYPFKEQRLFVMCEKGTLVFDDQASWSEKVKIYPYHFDSSDLNFEAGEMRAVNVPHAEPLKTEMEAFIKWIAYDEKPYTDGQEGKKVLEVLKAADESQETGMPYSFISSSPKNYFCHSSSFIGENAYVGAGAKIWHFSHIMNGAFIGEKVSIGQNVFIADDVKIGAHSKIQNNVSVYKGVTLEEGVFCGPSCVFTNVKTPRATIERKSEYGKTLVKKYTTIGANATIVCGITLGEYSFIAAGSVVTKDVPPHALMAGVPAKRIGWVSHAGERLQNDLICPREGRKYRLLDENTLAEDKI